MRKFKISVNGNMYEVDVEEIGSSSPQVQAVTHAAPVAVVSAAPQVSAKPQATATPAPATQASAATPEGAEVVSCPIPGKILSIKVEVGQAVTAGDLILTLEAMKMENEIFCSTAGSVHEIRVTEGASVNPGDVLVVIA